MKISIITVTLNAGQLLDITVNSVMKQSHPDIDYIIVDGASTDNSLEKAHTLAGLHPNRIRIISEPDNGIYEAINKGISIARGEIIGLLHAGDRFSSDTILEEIDSAMSRYDCPFIYGDVHYTNISRTKTTRKYTSLNFRKELLLRGFAPPHPSFYARREIFRKYGFYKENYMIGADFEMFVRLMLINNIEGRYLPLDMVEMAPNGLSAKLRHRLITNNIEKYRALRENSIKICRFSLLLRYLHIFKTFKL